MAYHLATIEELFWRHRLEGWHSSGRLNLTLVTCEPDSAASEVYAALFKEFVILHRRRSPSTSGLTAGLWSVISTPFAEPLLGCRRSGPERLLYRCATCTSSDF